MMRATQNIDELVDSARECMRREDYAEAAALLRTANSMAPLRQDIRALLGAALCRTPVCGSEPLRAHREKRPSPKTDPTPKTAQKRGLGSIGSLWRRFSRPSDNDAQPKPQSASPVSFDTKTPFKAAPTPLESWNPSAKSPLVSGSVTPPQTEEEEPDVFYLKPRNFVVQETPSPKASSREPFTEEPAEPVTEAPLATQEEEPTVQAAPVRKEQPRRLRHGANGSELLSTWRQYFSKLKSPSSRFMASASVYAFITLFVAASSGFSYAKFFWPARQQLQAQDNTTSKPDVDEQPQDQVQAAMAAPAVAASHEKELIQLASDYVMRKRYDDAVSLLSPAVEATSAKTEHEKITALLATACDQKGTVLLENSKLLESVEYYSRAVDLKPTNAEYALHLGNAYYYCGKYLTAENPREYHEKAVKCLQRVVELDRGNIQAYQMLGTVYECLKQRTQARAAWDKVRKIDPSSDEAALAEKHLSTLTQAEPSRKQWDKVRKSDSSSEETASAEKRTRTSTQAEPSRKQGGTKH